MDGLYLVLGALLAGVVVWRIEHSLPRCPSWGEYVGNTAAWCAVVGGGTYGLALFDSRLLPDFSFLYMGIVIVCTMGVALMLERRVRGRNTW